ncbi:MAG: ABZJ_00895 family protein [Pseudomonadota bacterium]
MWKPQRFLRNLFVFTFMAMIAFGPIVGIFGTFFAVAVLFYAPVAYAASREGFLWATRMRRVPDTACVKRASVVMAEVYLTFMVIVSGVLAISDTAHRTWLAQTNLLGILLTFGVLTAIAFPVIRWCYTLGAAWVLEREDNNTG